MPTTPPDSHEPAQQTPYPPGADPFGQALLDHWLHLTEPEDRQAPPLPTLTLHSDGGYEGPAMPAAWFLQPAEQWHSWEQAQLAQIVAQNRGPVLDLGCGGGRASVYLQDHGVQVTALDASPGAVEVCQRRGLVDVRLGDLRQPPTDHAWRTVLMLCGNIGIGGDWDENRRLLRQLARITADDAVLIGDTVDPSVGLEPGSDFDRHQHAQVAAGKYIGQIGLRLSYGDQRSPWWQQCNIREADAVDFIAGTGWILQDQTMDGMDHYLALAKAT